MTRDEIIRMAQKAECGWLLGIGGFPAFIETFAALHREALIASGELVEAPPQDVEISEPAIPFVPTVRCPVCHTYGHHHSKTCRYQGSGMTHHSRMEEASKRTIY